MRGRRVLLWIALLAIVAGGTLAAHWPVLRAQAVYMDDREYLLSNHLVRDPGWPAARQFLVEVTNPSTVPGYYQPLTMISLMLDWSRGGSATDFRAFHQTNLALHVVNALLVVIVLTLLFGDIWIAAAAGLLFGVHPLTVETLAWLAERKTLLATCGTLGALVLYLWSVRRPRGRWLLLTGSAVLFGVALLAKPTVTPLPLLLIVLDYWPLRRRSRTALLEKIPYFVLALAAGIITLISQQQAAGLTMPDDYGPLRIPLTLCHNIIFYLAAFVWPFGLSAFQPFPTPLSLANPWLVASVVGTILLLAALVVSLRWTRAFAVGWGFFFVGILPTMGIIGFTRVIAALKYMYFPVLGFLLVLCWAALGEANEKHPNRDNSRRTIGLVALILFAAVCGVVVHGQYRYWQTTEALYRHLLDKSPNVAVLHHDLGIELARQGRLDEAIEQYRATLALDARRPDTYTSLGNALVHLHRPAEAVPYFEQAIDLASQKAAPYAGLAAALAQQGQLDAALRRGREALERDKFAPEIHLNLALILLQMRRYDEAIEHGETALRLAPSNTQIAEVLRRARQMKQQSP